MRARSALEATQGQMDGFSSQLVYQYHLEEVASVGNALEICPQLICRLAHHESALALHLDRAAHLLLLFQPPELRLLCVLELLWWWEG